MSAESENIGALLISSAVGERSRLTDTNAYCKQSVFSYAKLKSVIITIVELRSKFNEKVRKYLKIIFDVSVVIIATLLFLRFCIAD